MMAMAERSMMQNEGTIPRRGVQIVGTLAEVKEQMANEEAGYPSNIHEANKTKQLEQRVVGIESGIQQILSRLTGGTSEPLQPQPPPPTVPQSSAPRSPAPTLRKAGGPKSPAQVQPSLTETLNSLGSETNSAPCTSRRIRSLTEVPRLEDLPEPIGPVEKFVDEDGTVGLRQQLVATDELLENPDMWVEAPAAPPPADPIAVMLSTRLPEVTAFLKSHDCRTYFSNTIKRHISKFMGFESWSPKLREQFTHSFNTVLSDPVFVRVQVLAALTSEFGKAISVEKITQLVIQSAGWMAFALAAAESNP
jgi:hypothetical protein